MTYHEAKSIGPGLVAYWMIHGKIQPPASKPAVSLTERVLAEIEELTEPTPIQGIADLMCMDRSTVAVVVHQLVRDGKVVKLDGKPMRYAKTNDQAQRRPNNAAPSAKETIE